MTIHCDTSDWWVLSIIIQCSAVGDDLGRDAEPSLVKQLQLPAFSASLEKAGQGFVQNTDSHKALKSNKSNEMETTPPFILGEALPVVPAKLA